MALSNHSGHRHDTEERLGHVALGLVILGIVAAMGAVVAG